MNTSWSGYIDWQRFSMSLLMLSGILQETHTGRKETQVYRYAQNNLHNLQFANDLFEVTLRDLPGDNLHHSLADVADLAGFGVARFLDLVRLSPREPNAKHPQ